MNETIYILNSSAGDTSLCIFFYGWKKVGRYIINSLFLCKISGSYTSQHNERNIGIEHISESILFKNWTSRKLIEVYV